MQLYKIVHLIEESFLITFPVYNNERLLYSIFFDILIDKLRAMFQNYDIIEVEYDYAKFIVKRPPLGSRFNSNRTYVTPNNLTISKNIRNAILNLKGRYYRAQTILRQLGARQRQQKQLRVILNYNTSEESENDEALNVEAADGSF